MRRAALVAGLALVASACATNPPPRRVDAGLLPPIGAKAEGTASWYGPGYEGKRTASGERFDPNALTAAHGTWAFGVVARVTLLTTGRSVEVRINDRLPRRDRVIDLSKEAAKRIGLIGPGTGKVRLEVVAVPGDDGT
jgi:rare lipoprotein A